MAFITLSGTLLDPNGDLAVGDQIRFTHKSTTGETVQSAVSIITVNPAGTYSLPLQYGLVLVEYKDVRTQQFKNLGVATVNGTNPATSIPELLNALVPVSSAELIEFQAILADCVTAQTAAENAATTAEAFAYQLTTTDLIASTATFAAETNIPTSGFTTSGDGGSGSWKQNGVTGQTPSQSPAQLGDALLNDGNGNQWGLVFKSEINIAQLGSGFDVTNDVSPANAALSALNAIGGGNLVIDLSTKVIFATNLDIPANCAIVGGHLYLDTTDRDKWPAMGSRIRLASTATIGTQNGSGLKGMLVYRDDMTFPAAGLTAAEVAMYAGTAITVKSAAPYIGYCTFLGFNLAITTAATNTPRGRLEYNNIDCLSGVKVDLDLGAWTIAYNYCQPILSNSDADNIRSGIGFDLVNKSDWTTLIGNFAFQDTGFRITDSNQIKLIGCGADHPTDGTDLYNTGVSFEIKGDSQDNYLIGCQGASHKSGLQVLTDVGTRNYVSDSHFWNMASDGFGYEILGGEVGISGGSIRGFISNGGKGVFVNNANAKVSISAGLRMKNISVGMDTPAFDEFLVSQDLSFDSVSTIRSNESIKQVVSSGNVVPLQNETIQEITGATTIGTFVGAGVMPQKIITFIINDGLTINNGNTLLDGAVNWVAPAGSSITLQYITGNTWREISRNEQ